MFTLILTDHLRTRSTHAAISDEALRSFGTKHREPFLDETIRPRIHGYLATVIRDLGSPWVVVGGIADHVHAV